MFFTDPDLRRKPTARAARAIAPAAPADKLIEIEGGLSVKISDTSFKIISTNAQGEQSTSDIDSCDSGTVAKLYLESNRPKFGNWMTAIERRIETLYEESCCDLLAASFNKRNNLLLDFLCGKKDIAPLHEKLTRAEIESLINIISGLVQDHRQNLRLVFRLIELGSVLSMNDIEKCNGDEVGRTVRADTTLNAYVSHIKKINDLSDEELDDDSLYKSVIDLVWAEKAEVEADEEAEVEKTDKEKVIDWLTKMVLELAGRIPSSGKRLAKEYETKIAELLHPEPAPAPAPVPQLPAPRVPIRDASNPFEIRKDAVRIERGYEVVASKGKSRIWAKKIGQEWWVDSNMIGEQKVSDLAPSDICMLYDEHQNAHEIYKTQIIPLLQTRIDTILAERDSSRYDFFYQWHTSVSLICYLSDQVNKIYLDLSPYQKARIERSFNYGSNRGTFWYYLLKAGYVFNEDQILRLNRSAAIDGGVCKQAILSYHGYIEDVARPDVGTKLLRSLQKRFNVKGKHEVVKSLFSAMVALYTRLADHIVMPAMFKDKITEDLETKLQNYGIEDPKSEWTKIETRVREAVPNVVTGDHIVSLGVGASFNTNRREVVTIEGQEVPISDITAGQIQKILYKGRFFDERLYQPLKDKLEKRILDLYDSKDWFDIMISCGRITSRVEMLDYIFEHGVSLCDRDLTEGDHDNIRDYIAHSDYKKTPMVTLLALQYIFNLEELKQLEPGKIIDEYRYSRALRFYIDCTEEICRIQAQELNDNPLFKFVSGRFGCNEKAALVLLLVEATSLIHSKYYGFSLTGDEATVELREIKNRLQRACSNILAPQDFEGAWSRGFLPNILHDYIKLSGRIYLQINKGKQGGVIKDETRVETIENLTNSDIYMVYKRKNLTKIPVDIKTHLETRIWAIWNSDVNGAARVFSRSRVIMEFITNKSKEPGNAQKPLYEKLTKADDNTVITRVNSMHVNVLPPLVSLGFIFSKEEISRQDKLHNPSVVKYAQSNIECYIDYISKINSMNAADLRESVLYAKILERFGIKESTEFADARIGAKLEVINRLISCVRIMVEKYYFGNPEKSTKLTGYLEQMKAILPEIDVEGAWQAVDEDVEMQVGAGRSATPESEIEEGEIVDDDEEVELEEIVVGKEMQVAAAAEPANPEIDLIGEGDAAGRAVTPISVSEGGVGHDVDMLVGADHAGAGRPATPESEIEEGGIVVVDEEVEPEEIVDDEEMQVVAAAEIPAAPEIVDLTGDGGYAAAGRAVTPALESEEVTDYGEDVDMIFVEDDASPAVSPVAFTQARNAVGPVVLPPAGNAVGPVVLPPAGNAVGYAGKRATNIPKFAHGERGLEVTLVVQGGFRTLLLNTATPSDLARIYRPSYSVDPDYRSQTNSIEQKILASYQEQPIAFVKAVTCLDFGGYLLIHIINSKVNNPDIYLDQTNYKPIVDAITNKNGSKVLRLGCALIQLGVILRPEDLKTFNEEPFAPNMIADEEKKDAENMYKTYITDIARSSQSELESSRVFQLIRGNFAAFKEHHADHKVLAVEELIKSLVILKTKFRSLGMDKANRRRFPCPSINTVMSEIQDLTKEDSIASILSGSGVVVDYAKIEREVDKQIRVVEVKKETGVASGAPVTTASTMPTPASSSAGAAAGAPWLPIPSVGAAAPASITPQQPSGSGSLGYWLQKVGRIENSGRRDKRAAGPLESRRAQRARTGSESDSSREI